MNNIDYQGSNMLSLKKYVDKKRIIFNIIVGTLTIITVCMVSYYIINTSIKEKKSKQYTAQIIEYKKQREIQEGREQLEQKERKKDRKSVV